ncbi:MAG: purine-binding chemotaxis protein CheW [Gammaproteobacteria bacterium]|nr:purine-binding chemotaxis protein CheW [Gammaproteobacteria bacterium]
MNVAEDHSSHSTVEIAAAEQVLCFRLGPGEFGIDVLKIQEIKGWDTVTRVPYAPRYLLGVINLRGAIVPVIDLRLRFALSAAPFDSTTVVIVVRVRGARGERIVGIVVDAVSEVLDLAAGALRPAPGVPGEEGSGYLRGIASQGDRLIMIVDVEALVASSIDREEDAGLRPAA